ncbi:heat-shock protein [Bdellovibrio bacteriovorus]|uniref:Heat-shock protein n=1 Tax=Bdellovibrio bacteriovorus TaxID=959 RepID=A0A150WMQ9_BDEBC|nr:M48 family metalloprotease [Bdellovibrio bacteriovorus]KYG65678.1 heat-shock protein [Bdellovibrio bacteriovorus]
MLNNNTKVWIFILSSSFALLILGYQLGERLGLFVGFLLALALNFFVFFYGESRVLAKLDARRVKGQDSWGLLEKVQRLSEKLNMPTPAVYVTPHAAVNAFCVGHSWKRGSLGFTAGLLKSLNNEELEAVVAHQLCHIRRLDTFAFSVSSTIGNSVVGMGQFFDSFMPYKLKLFMPMLSPVGWVIIKTVVGEKSFFENDLMAADLLESRLLLGEVLWRMEGLAQTMPLEIPACTSHLFMVNPEGFQQKNLFLKSHPSIENRIQKLMGYYPI